MAYVIQTIIVSKELAPSEEEAARIAKDIGKVYTSRETSDSWRFRQRPPEDFRQGSFRTQELRKGVTVIYGELN